MVWHVLRSFKQFSVLSSAIVGKIAVECSIGGGPVQASAVSVFANDGGNKPSAHE
jgi:hypothetical protein